MRIPAHQVHNVLSTYARRLKKKHDARQGPITDADQDAGLSYSAETKRRAIIDKLSADILMNVTRFSSAPWAPPDKEDARNTEPTTEEIPYNVITKNGEKISATMKIRDTDFLTRNSNGSEGEAPDAP